MLDFDICERPMIDSIFYLNNDDRNIFDDKLLWKEYQMMKLNKGLDRCDNTPMRTIIISKYLCRYSFILQKDSRNIRP